MPTYSYRCSLCGPFDLVRPMSAAGPDAPCPDCGTTARRVFGGPALRSLHAGVRAALEASEGSADSPDVVSAIPASGRRRGATTQYSRDPRHARLPRP